MFPSTDRSRDDVGHSGVVKSEPEWNVCRSVNRANTVLKNLNEVSKSKIIF